MPNIDVFADFVAAPYQTAPQLPLQTLVVLIKSLSARLPDDAPIYILAAEQEMRAAAAEAEAAMVIRLRETNEGRLIAALQLDNAVDGLWSLCRERTNGWQRYDRPGLDFLVDDDELEVDFEAVRETAARAAELSTKIFGEGAMEMLSKPYPEQSQLMANVLGLIDTDGFSKDLLEITGDELLPIIRRCQAQYEAMVDSRSSLEPASRADLRAHRARLQRYIVRYSTLVLTLMSEDKPATRELVETALEPMITLRAQRRTGTGVELSDDEGAPEAGDEVELELAAAPEPGDE